MKSEYEGLKDIFYCDFEVWDPELRIMKKCGKRAKFHAGRSMHVCEEHAQNRNYKLIKSSKE